MNKYHQLYVVATPIGNLQEITDLAKKVLFEATTIVCEDTRVTKKLLKLLTIENQQKLVSFNKMSETVKTAKILELLQKESCVLVSDAGYPVISDPGYNLIRTLRKAGSQIQVINGPCALVHALVSSGIDSRKFFFANFLTKKRIQRISELNELKSVLNLATVVYYEALNFLEKGLNILLEVFGDIEIGIARELSKIHETFYYGKISELKKTIELRGEFVIILPKQKTINESESEAIILAKLEEHLQNNISLKNACKLVATPNLRASEIYKIYLLKKGAKNE
ncbi:16S rRNA (cytidine1402-2'-O)-methyltransferase [Mycoplasmoides fastidiosum]|uniref:Ribosomal RNA small subunit methyltransferase I n=1 Tax=Mycoplasmoides fastidiosum TaxID=92758 RepID=A0ABU0LZP6_9BACT|nr:16S rRNA (cytidine(1402)-2'-O)-methyltransferase [Mycoplasmoides fastidiosum]MDQ0514154.1 16S rRNA (cytidine1402-2'-O)-methyltransferase [Mycoplasmoides fastidiosum]UUD37438.1 16S rRNA (cytidine(1402)-2'-O)-methyltransferase [Mycoplasmoides fastidiosum]